MELLMWEESVLLPSKRKKYFFFFFGSCFSVVSQAKAFIGNWYPYRHWLLQKNIFSIVSSGFQWHITLFRYLLSVSSVSGLQQMLKNIQSFTALGISFILLTSMDACVAAAALTHLELFPRCSLIQISVFSNYGFFVWGACLRERTDVDSLPLRAPGSWESESHKALFSSLIKALTHLN